jgi:hypothetical protein
LPGRYKANLASRLRRVPRMPVTPQSRPSEGDVRVDHHLLFAPMKPRDGSHRKWGHTTIFMVLKKIGQKIVDRLG